MLSAEALVNSQGKHQQGCLWESLGSYLLKHPGGFTWPPAGRLAELAACMGASVLGPKDYQVSHILLAATHHRGKKRVQHISLEEKLFLHEVALSTIYWKSLPSCQLVKEKCLRGPAPVSQSRAMMGVFGVESNITVLAQPTLWLTSFQTHPSIHMSIKQFYFPHNKREQSQQLSCPFWVYNYSSNTFTVSLSIMLPKDQIVKLSSNHSYIYICLYLDIYMFIFGRRPKKVASIYKWLHMYNRENTQNFHSPYFCNWHKIIVDTYGSFLSFLFLIWLAFSQTISWSEFFPSWNDANAH